MESGSHSGKILLTVADERLGPEVRLQGWVGSNHVDTPRPAT